MKMFKGTMSLKNLFLGGIRLKLILRDEIGRIGLQ